MSTSVLPIDPRIEALQVAYIRKVVDTVQELPNVLYEVANESSGMTAVAVRMPDGMTIDTPIGDSTRWQYWVIGEVKRYEQEQGYSAHPVGMTFHDGDRPQPVRRRNLVRHPSRLHRPRDRTGLGP
jgi:hypothetical protein